MLFAQDLQWWKEYAKPVKAGFAGKCYTQSQRVPAHIAERIELGARNSGAGAILLAEMMGAIKIVLLGYDCGYAADGRRHWHGDHPTSMGNAGSAAQWQGQFSTLAKQVNARIINASRSTRLTCFPQQELEQALC